VAKRRYWLPEPRLAVTPALRRYASAAMDVSDGFAGDLAKLCRASGVGARVSFEEMPLDPAARALARRDPTAIPDILSGGDDYEILFTVPNRDDHPLAAIRACKAAGVEAHWVGNIVEGTGVTITLAGEPIALERASYSHF
jgi:thiamine-monophosphate kinase